MNKTIDEINKEAESNTKQLLESLDVKDLNLTKRTLETYSIDVKPSEVAFYEAELSDYGLVKYVDFFTIGQGFKRQIHLMR
jgi:hypothetical protein